MRDNKLEIITKSGKIITSEHVTYGIGVFYNLSNKKNIYNYLFKGNEPLIIEVKKIMGLIKYTEIIPRDSIESIRLKGEK
jgi:hypothetical protein